MLNKRQQDIIMLLQKFSKSWLTAQKLAQKYQVTQRTIRDDISKIKQQYPNLILSSNKGYSISKNINKEELEHAYPEDRLTKIFLSLIKHSQEGVDIFELADSLFISESTLKNNIQQLKTKLPSNILKIEINKNVVKLNGSEHAKRKYMISLLYDESDFKEQLKLSVKNMISHISLSKLEEIIQSELEKLGITINIYSLYNIALHFAISIERVSQGYTIKNSEENYDIKGTQAFKLGKKIASKISKIYNVTFNEAEIKYLSLLFIGVQAQEKDSVILNNYVDYNIISTLKKVLKQVESVYHIDLSDKEFFNKLAIHIQSLYYRSQYDSFVHNSSIQDIKGAYPLIYDISVYISSLIQDNLQIWFNDDEVSFIALHLGALLESQKKSHSNIKIAVISEDYHQLDSIIKQKLNKLSNCDISFVKLSELKQKNYDIILTTNPSAINIDANINHIHPIPTKDDISKIDKMILVKSKEQQIKIIHKYIDKFIKPELFFNQFIQNNISKGKIIKLMVNRMQQHNFVTSEYVENVEKREQISPTSFPSGVAVPHSIKLDALKSGVSIMTLPQTVMWSKYPVKIVALIAINPKESKEYNDFFEMFINVLTDKTNVKRLSESNDFEEFIKKLKDSIVNI